MKCKSRNNCAQYCSSYNKMCPLVDCESKERSCRQFGGAERMVIRAQQGYQYCNNGNCKQNCTASFNCYQNCKGNCQQYCTAGNKCEQSCGHDGKCQQLCNAKTCNQRCTEGGNCKMTCKAKEPCTQRCPQGGCQTVCDSPSCLQLCNSGNCSLLCKGMQCQQNCTGGGCHLSCFLGANVCKQHCPSNNCTITRTQRPKRTEMITFQISSGQPEVTFNEAKTTNSGKRVSAALTFSTIYALWVMMISFTY